MLLNGWLIFTRRDHNDAAPVREEISPRQPCVDLIHSLDELEEA
jgi:hypothetical protein